MISVRRPDAPRARALNEYRRSAWAALALGLFVLEVLIATVWARVPVVRADLGDYFVVLLIYAAAKTVRPFRATR